MKRGEDDGRGSKWFGGVVPPLFGRPLLNSNLNVQIACLDFDKLTIFMSLDFDQLTSFKSRLLGT